MTNAISTLNIMIYIDVANLAFFCYNCRLDPILQAWLTEKLSLRPYIINAFFHLSNDILQLP